MHTISQIVCHSITGISKSVRKGGNNSRFIAKTCNLHLTQAFFTHYSQDLTWQDCQAKEEASHLGASVSTCKVHPSKSKWMKPNK
jgi:hypothetical protein